VVVAPFVFCFRSPRGGESLAGCGRGGGGIRVFGRALAQGGWRGNGRKIQILLS